MRFEFATAGRIVFGSGTIAETGKLAASLGKRALLVTGSNPDRCEPLTRSLLAAGVAHTLFAVDHEPSISDVEHGVEAARTRGCDLVISMGGGSAIDCGKAVAAMLANPGVLLDYLEVIGAGKALPNRSLPFMAVPTTSGTGSEVTRNAVLSSPEHKVKVSLRSAGMLPTLALVDPELTLGLPPALTASTGMDAFTQVLEAYVSSRANPFTDGLCKEGLRRVATSFKTACRDGANLSAREEMSIVSVSGGVALANAGLGAVHGFAGPMGGMFDAPHGALCAALLPHVMETNIRALKSRSPASPYLRRYDEVARIITGQPDADAAQGVAWVRDLVREIGIPSLAKYGVTPDHADAVVSKACRASSMKGNPIELTGPELKAVLLSAL